MTLLSISLIAFYHTFWLDFAFFDWEFSLKLGAWDSAWNAEACRSRLVQLNSVNSNPNLVLWNWLHWKHLGNHQESTY